VEQKHSDLEERIVDNGTTRRKQSTAAFLVKTAILLSLAIIIGEMQVLLEGVTKGVLVISGRYVVKHLVEI
jgi:hypothetical protein